MCLVSVVLGDSFWQPLGRMPLPLEPGAALRAKLNPARMLVMFRREDRDTPGRGVMELSRRVSRNVSTGGSCVR